MTITFLMPCYAWGPSGGFRVVYEYATRLVKRGHSVNVVHPRRLLFIPRARLSLYWRLRAEYIRLREAFHSPRIDWVDLDPRVKLFYTATSHPRNLPDGDFVFATAWHTVASVSACPAEKGAKGYLIQGYEAWQGPKDYVDSTWRLPLHKVVVSRWLAQIGSELGATDLTYIPNGVDCRRYYPKHPPVDRGRRVAMMYSTVPSKGSAEAFQALEAAKAMFPELQAVAFGVSRRPESMPAWITYHRNPAQDFLIDDIYGKSSIFLSSSWAEGFALPPAEAMACGCAVVATDSGGIRDFVRHELSGLLCAPKDSGALARNLCRVLADGTLRLDLVNRGLETIRAFDWERSTARLERFIAEAVSPAECGLASRV